MNIQNVHSIHNPSQYSLSSDKVNIPENFAKNMPNALIKVSETQINKNINNNLNNNTSCQVNLLDKSFFIKKFQ